ncbi:MAG: ABC transporter substrate-binding protein [Nocardioidaceae bacterium]
MNPLVREPNPLTRRGFLTLTAAGSLGVMAGCGNGKGVGDTGAQGVGNFTGGEYNGPPVTLSYWNGFTGGDGPSMDALVKRFNDENKKITIKQNTMQWADFEQRLPAAAQAGKGPDVGVMHLSSVASHAARQVIVPLDDLAKALKLDESDFVSAVWKGGIYQGKRYGIPLDVHCLAMYWNKDHFAKAGISAPPTDEASFEAALKKLQAAGFKQPFWMPNQWPAHLMFMSILWQNGGEPIASDGSKATFDSDAGIKALTWQREQVTKGYSPSNVDIDAQYLAFKNGKNSITWDGIWQINDLKAAGTNFGIAPIPAIGTKPAVWGDSHQFFMTAQAAKDKNRANAVKTFIQWLSEQSSAWSGAGMVPARNSVRQDAKFTNSPQAALKDDLDNIHFLPPVPGWGDVEPTTMDTAVAESILGKKQPADALHKAAENATKLMEQNKKKFG